MNMFPQLNRLIIVAVISIAAAGCTIENIDQEVGPPPPTPPPTTVEPTDTDGDGLSDEQEMAIGTSIDLVDTDGDGLSDNEEVTNGGFNPLIADLPNITINVVDSPSIQINVTYEENSGQQSEFNATYERGQESSYSRSDTTATSSTMESSTRISAEVSVSVGVIPGGSASVSAESNVASSSTKEFSTNTTSSSGRSSREEFGRYQGATSGETIQAETGTLSATLEILNDSTLAYELSSVAVIAKKRSADGQSVVPVGTLTFATAQPEILSPGERIQSQITTDQTSLPVLKELMSNPSGLIFTVGSYAIRELGEGGLDFALQNQDVASKTAQVVIDYGDNLIDGTSPVETYMVATNVDRDPVTLEARGISMRSVMQDILQIDYQTVEQNVPDENGSPTEAMRSILSMVRGQQSIDSENGFWYVFSNSTSLNDPATDFEDIVLMPRDRITLVFLADRDGDGLYNREEYLLGTDFDNEDSDNDGLTDFEEARTGWIVMDGQSEYRVFSDPLNVDADGDLVSDFDERAQNLDPDRADTDGDTISDLDDDDPNGGVSGVSFNLDFIGPGQDITMSGSVGPAGELQQVRIDWGDGQGEQVISNNLANIRASRSYPAKGNYVIRVTVDRVVGNPVERRYNVTLADMEDEDIGGFAGWDGTLYQRELLDVNDDGLSDLVGFGPDGFWVALADGNGFMPATLARAEFANDDMDIANPNADGIGYEFKKYVLANVGGDSAPDIVAFDVLQTPDDVFESGVWVSINDGAGNFDQPDIWTDAFGPTDGIQPIHVVADINSDGLGDIVAFEAAGVGTALSFGISFSVQDPSIHTPRYGSSQGWGANHPRVLSDVNGDNYPDIVGFFTTETIATLNDQSGGFNGDTWRISAMSDDQAYFATRHPRMAIDVTSPDDAEADLVAYANAGAFGIRATPTGFESVGFTLSSEFGYFDGWRLDQHPRFLIDMNDDGYRDLIGFSPNAVVYAVNARANGRFDPPATWPLMEPLFIDGWNGFLDARLVGDINGDGNADLVGIDVDSVMVEFGARIEPQ
ncbi:MAG: hypothetical protein GXP15_16520 [Gammaproteobacteria bacterium]|nr:hypothetical protein [Gammaproteobacteria bacterium]